MKRNKILICLITCIFLCSVLPVIVSEQPADETSYAERRIIDNKDVKAVYTQKGLQPNPTARGKPGVTVDITYPPNGATVSGTVTITITSNNIPTITIDGTTVGTGLSYNWNTLISGDGSHTIAASAKGVTDTVTVTVANGGGSNTAPTVTITNPNNGATVTGTVTITVTATDPEDGSLTPTIKIDGVQKATSTSYTWDTTTGYSDGSHTIYATATDSGGLSDDHQITVTVANGGGGDVDKHALVIGISDYEGTSSDLQYCDDDAMDWKNFLQGKGYTVTTLIDSQATADNIIAAINTLLAAEDADDYVVFCYSGHGTKITPYGSCIVSHDLYGVDHGYIESLFATANSPHIFFSFDACVIGDFQGLVITNRVGAFASNSRNSYDGDSTMKNGVFTYYQMQGWTSYTNFEEDSAYAVQYMKSWASAHRVRVDPFYKDSFTGSMLP